MSVQTPAHAPVTAEFAARATAARIHWLNVRIAAAKRRKDFRTVRVLLAHLQDENP